MLISAPPLEVTQNFNDKEDGDLEVRENFYVYILCSRRDGMLYTGVTNDLIKRVYEHKNKLTEGYTKKYNIDKLVYYEHSSSIEGAIIREKQIKHWKRSYRITLIEKENPEWVDLYDNLLK